MRYCTPLLLTAFLFACQDSSSPSAPEAGPAVSPQAASSRLGSGSIVLVNLGFSAARDVDQQGRVVGWKGTGSPARAVLWVPATPRGATGSLTVLSGQTSETYATGLNEQDEIAGGSSDGAHLHARVWSAAALHAIGEPAGAVESFAEDISNPLSNGERLVIGRTDFAASSRATVWRVSGTGSSFTVSGIVMLPGFRADGSGQAIGVNSSGLVVGDALTAGSDLPQPSKWTFSGTSWSISALGLLPGQTSGQVLDVSASGDAVGFNRQAASTGCPHGAVWPANTLTPKPLQDLSGGFCSIGWAINAAGQITGSARDARGRDQAVLWLRNGSGTYDILTLGNLHGAHQSEGRGLNEPQAGASGGMELEVVGRSGSAATLWKVRLP